MEQLVERLRAQGGKVTPQRVRIYEALIGDDSHPTAEELHARLVPLLPHLSLTTVYAALHDLADAGEVRCFQAAGQVHFDPDTRPHAEMVCVRCHRIQDAPEPFGRSRVPEVIGRFRVLARTELLHGICPECAARDEGQAEREGSA